MAPNKIKINDSVWLRAGAKGATDPFVPATVTNVQQNGARVTVKRASSTEEEVLDTSKSDIFPANEKGMTAGDHCALIHLNEPCILENSKLRFASDSIYTYTGKILVALNPFGPLKIYGEEAMAKYKDKEIGAKGVEPHVYAMGEAAYKHVKRHKSPAALVMSGESGAGKTETTKHLMRYLAWRSESVSSKAVGKLGQLADAILSTNPLLEAFGNAKTVRNNNSSRFGKMMRLHFEPMGSVSGAVIKTYLLEKSRAVAITNPERNYHIFYQIMSGASAAGKGAVLSGYKHADMRMLNQSQCITLDRVDDTQAFKETFGAMEKLGVDDATQTQLQQCLSALLLLGNVTFEQDDNDRADVTNQTDLAAAETLLGCGSLTSLLTTRTVQRGGGPGKRTSTYQVDFNKAQAQSARDAAIKAMYTRLFDWIIAKVNGHISGGDTAKDLPYVGLLDIFGFENFVHNSFEQLCINFANEKLQQFFLTCVFKEEETLHVKEGVPWQNIEYQDNAGCIQMLEKPPNGILRLLDSQCKTPNATEATFCKELNRVHMKADFLVPTRKVKMRDEEGFVIAHYAGQVVYHTAEIIGKATKVDEVPWLEKNNDTLQAEWLAKLMGSSLKLVTELFAEEHAANEKARKPGTFSSVGKRFVNDLNSLLTELQASKAAFIRCVKPNAEQAAKKFTASMVLDQLRCSGVVEAVRVMLEAYPTRINYEDIHGRYAPLMGAEIVAETGDQPAAFCAAIAEACEVAPADFALGMTKLFLKAGCGTFLEDLAAMDPAVVVPLLTEKIAAAKRKAGAASLLGNFVLTWYTRKRYREQKKAIELAQHRMRTIKARREYQKWSKERQVRLKKEAEERAAKEAAEKAAREAAEALRKQQEEELARTAAAEQAAKKKAQEEAMKAAVEKAKAEAEAKLKAEMEAAEKAAEQSAVREREKHGIDITRADSTALPADGMHARRKSVSDGAASSGGAAPRRASFGDAASAAVYASNYNEDGGVPDDGEDKPSLSKASSKKVVQEEFFDVTITRDVQGGTLGIAVDLWDGEVTVGAITTNGPADREGTLIQGDIIRAVEGEPCSTIEEVTMCVIKGGISLVLSICRRPVSVVFESDIRMRMPDGSWEPFAFRLLSNRNIEFEKLSPPQYTGEIHARLAQSLSIKDEGVEKVLVIETGHKAFEIKAGASELAHWHLRLQEVIMLQEKVANVAHGWLLKEEMVKGESSLRHFWFVLFSNGILMHFSDPNRANLGQSLGFIPVESCTESSHSANQHTLLIKCDFDQWLLATNSKENMLQWAASLHAAHPTKGANKPPATDFILAQGWLDLPKEQDDDEVWVRHWFVLKNSMLMLYSEDMKTKGDLRAPVVQLATSAMKSATRAKGVDFYKWGIVLETNPSATDGASATIRLRAIGQSEMRQLLSTLNVHCIETAIEEEKVEFQATKSVVKSGYLYKKSLKTNGPVRMGKAWQRRWFVLQVETNAGRDESTVVRTGKLTYYASNKETKDGVEIPLQEVLNVKSSLGKTKGTERRITIVTQAREFELGCDDPALQESWIAELQSWIGLPKVERMHRASIVGEATVVKSQWMEARIEVYTPDEISDEELARSNTIQKTVSSFSRTFTLSRKKKKEEPEAPTPTESTKSEEGDEDDEDDDEEEAFNWVFVAFMSDGTLRQYSNEMMDEELARLKLGYLAQADFLDDPPDTYEHAFRVKPEDSKADTWVLCPDSTNDSDDWMAVLKA